MTEELKQEIRDLIEKLDLLMGSKRSRGDVGMRLRFWKKKQSKILFSDNFFLKYYIEPRTTVTTIDLMYNPKTNEVYLYDNGKEIM